MQAFNKQVLDETISGTSSTWYSSADFNELLGQADRLGVSAVVGDVSGSNPSLRVRVDHSADGEHWSELGPEINTEITSNTTYMMAFEGGLALLRFRVMFAGGTNPQCRLKLNVIGRLR
jgi:hypothetical protein